MAFFQNDDSEFYDEGEVSPDIIESDSDVASEVEDDLLSQYRPPKQGKKLKRKLLKDARVSAKKPERKGEDNHSLTTLLAMKQLGLQANQRELHLYQLLVKTKNKESLFSFLRQPKDVTMLNKVGKIADANFTLSQLLDPASLFDKDTSYFPAGTTPWLIYGAELAKKPKQDPILLSFLEQRFLLASTARMAVAVENISKTLPFLLTVLSDNMFPTPEKAKAYRWTLKTQINFLNEELWVSKGLLTKRTPKENTSIWASDQYEQINATHYKRLDKLKMDDLAEERVDFIGRKIPFGYSIPSLTSTRALEKVCLSKLNSIVYGKSKNYSSNTPSAGRQPKKKQNKRKRKKKEKIKSEPSGPATPPQPRKKQRKNKYDMIDKVIWDKYTAAEKEAYKIKQKNRKG